MSSDTDLTKALARQEQLLTFPHFDEDTAFAVGNALRAAAAARNAPVVIDIRTPNRRLFFAALPGTTPDNDEWARRKANVALRYHQSSLQTAMAWRAEGKVAGPDIGLDSMEFAAHGGAFPVRVAGAGVTACITVSGLPSREDHELIVAILARHLGVDGVSLDALLDHL